MRTARPPQGDHPEGNRGSQHGAEGCPRAALPQSHGERALAVERVGADITQVVDHEQRAGDEPDPAGGEPRPSRHAPALDVKGAGGGHEPEEHEDEGLAESRIAVGAGTTRVEPGGRDRGGPQKQHPPLAGQRQQRQSEKTANPEAAEGGQLDDSGRHRPGSGQTRGAGALVVGAAHAVGVVVGEVAADLEREGDAGGQDGARRREGFQRQGRAPAQDHRSHGCGQSA